MGETIVALGSRRAPTQDPIIVPKDHRNLTGIEFDLLTRENQGFFDVIDKTYHKEITVAIQHCMQNAANVLVHTLSPEGSTTPYVITNVQEISEDDVALDFQILSYIQDRTGETKTFFYAPALSQYSTDNISEVPELSSFQRVPLPNFGVGLENTFCARGIIDIPSLEFGEKTNLTKKRMGMVSRDVDFYHTLATCYLRGTIENDW